MKKYLFLVFTACTFFTVTAQNGPVDFETTGYGADWTWTVFENDSNPELEIITNPDASGINTSATVAKFTALQAGEPFAGCETQHGADIGTFALDEFTSTITIMVWKSVISDVGIKLVEANSASLGEIKVANTVINQWEELSFDFSSMEGIVYDQIVVFPDFDERTMDNVVYFDNISFGGLPPLDAPMVAAPDPTIDPANVISLFSGVYTDVPVDTWQTPWSSASLSEIQIAGNDTKRYSALDFVGIETVGPNLIDASSMLYFHIDVWSPNINTFKIKLVDFGADGMFGGGDDSEHEIIYENQAQNNWISYEIPLADFTGLTSTSHIAQLILSGEPVGSGVLYVDNVYFSSIPTSVNDFKTENISMYPNPVQNNLIISSDKNIENIQIFNIVGKLVMDINTSGAAHDLDISHLTNGMYVITLTVDGIKAVDQFIKN
jgi:type IX secretion system substrate protein